jgi:hypothetical protein
LAISLYAPHVAKLLAYADCSIIALTNGDPRLCDCNKIVDTENIPLSTNQPDKQKEISVKADWKYVGETAYRFSKPMKQTGETKSSSPDKFIAEQFLRSVFHPPQV